MFFIFPINHVFCFEVDIWSLGVILYCCLCGHSPFLYDPDDKKMLFVQILKGSYTVPDEIKNTLSPEALDMIQKTLLVDPKKRISEQEIFKHKWMQVSFFYNIHTVVLSLQWTSPNLLGVVALIKVHSL